MWPPPLRICPPELCRRRTEGHPCRHRFAHEHRLPHRVGAPGPQRREPRREAHPPFGHHAHRAAGLERSLVRRALPAPRRSPGPLCRLFHLPEDRRENHFPGAAPRDQHLLLPLQRRHVERHQRHGRAQHRSPRGRRQPARLRTRFPLGQHQSCTGQGFHGHERAAHRPQLWPAARQRFPREGLCPGHRCR